MKGSCVCGCVRAQALACEVGWEAGRRGEGGRGGRREEESEEARSVVKKGSRTRLHAIARVLCARSCACVGVSACTRAQATVLSLWQNPMYSLAPITSFPGKVPPPRPLKSQTHILPPAA